MRHGPWDTERAIRRAIAYKELPTSIEGTKPIGVESCNGEARFTYCDPRKEPLPFSKFPPFRHYWLNESQRDLVSSIP